MSSRILLLERKESRLWAVIFGLLFLSLMLSYFPVINLIFFIISSLVIGWCACELSHTIRQREGLEDRQREG